jgi:AraC-like DNA-binding protein
MGFKIRLYQWPEIENGLLVIGIGRVELGTVTRSMPEPEEGLYRVAQEIFNAPGTVGPVEIPFLESVRKMILDSLKDGTPQLRRVADAFGLTPRTLERRLYRDGVDFTKLLDDARRRLAMDLLRDSKKKLTDIAHLLGYSEVSSFNRAFKRWTNSTPANFRKRHLRLAHKLAYSDGEPANETTDPEAR